MNNKLPLTKREASPWIGWSFSGRFLIDPEGNTYSQEEIASTKFLNEKAVCEYLRMTRKDLSTYKLRTRKEGYEGKFPKEAAPERWRFDDIYTYAKYQEKKRARKREKEQKHEQSLSKRSEA